MQCYTELLPPTGVTHALALPFVSATAKNLIVVRSSLLQVFSLRDPTSWRTGESTETSPSASHQPETKLPLITKSGGEAILLAVRNAKLSLVEWDPERHGISTVSIHYYEREDLTRNPWVPDLSRCESILSVDPSSRCAVFNFGVRNLAILPFHQAGDDLVMDDYDSELDGERPDRTQERSTGVEKSKDGSGHQTPYAASFVLPLTALDPSLLHPVSLAFLYEYREPTFGILYSQIATSNALLHERKDVMFYTVFTLDLEQRASTTLLSVTRLPSDLFKIVALPPPAGKTNAVGVNEFSRQMSSFSMSDQSDLAFRLEGCVVERLGRDSGDLLLALASGEMALIKFKLDGRSVSGMTVHPLPPQVGGDLLKSAASCSTCIGDGNIFIGSEDSDSVLLGWSTSSLSAKKARNESKRANDSVEEFSDNDQLDDDVYEDDLYSSVPESNQADPRMVPEIPTSELYHFRLNDRLTSTGSLRDITLGQAFPATKNTNNSAIEGVSAELELLASQGSGRAGGLAVIKREIDPVTSISMKIEDANGVWSVSVASERGSLAKSGDPLEENSFQHYVIVSRLSGSEKEISEVLKIEGQDLESFKAPEFNPNEDRTINIGALADNTRLVQVLRNEVRSYDIDLGLAQIYPIWDEDTDEERLAVSASFVDPYLAILRDDSSLLVLQADDSGDLDEVSLPDEISSSKWRSTCLYNDKHEAFGKCHPSPNAAKENVLIFLLSMDNKVSIFRLSDMVILSVIDGVDCLQPVLSAEPPRRSNSRELLNEVLVADLGDRWAHSPYLIVRTVNDDLAVYKPVFIPVEVENRLMQDLRFFREANHSLSNVTSGESSSLLEEKRGTRPLRVLRDVAGLSTVFLPGSSAGFLLKTAASSPHLVRLRGEFTRWMSGFHSSSIGCENGFIYVDSDNWVRACQLPPDTQFDYPWTLRKIPMEEQVDFLTYSTSSNTYVLGTSSKVGFKLPEDDELHPEWRMESITFLPEVPQSSVKVVSPKTWAVIDTYPLECAEHITAVKNVNLEISENTHERKDLIVVGTAIAKGEDIPSRGCIYVFEVIEVVPEPGQPETGRKLKLVGKETVKGAVTALSGIGSQGFIIVAQGQKCMVRGLKEDGSLLPVAFMDMLCYVNVAKELKGTGMCILGDAVKGIWFAGYSEEPYKMTLFGKDPDYLEVAAADFLPDGNKLYMLVADSDCNLHVLQYDPEDPKSSNGDRLLNRSKFYTGNFASTVTLLPRTPVTSELVESNDDEMDVDKDLSRHHVLITSQNGSLALVTSVTEESYRRLSALQSQLTNTIEHPCGLNPRAFRAVESDGAGGRGMIDGNLLRQWLSLGKQRQAEIAGRIGAKEWEIRADLETVGGDGLGYV
ncbi:Cleavage/polyadenylation specificity factor A subunit C-terminal [Penicillium maclennaniae]|uniref:Cleavage/polyadenylation specificity factor A subunit C-terminal n=1 Tax=Penicillium maclennaniae TaxID=1343394 RepID=UPI00253FE6A7|nr:Cleavage/polyadenylation specificity factor A subunit C-terminal [Penicillium maclennaniae]KAJ5677429.1 Cleavage/polyadenylation specificity factor A subunit C-terminal [Penicillium maclennaniae]